MELSEKIKLQIRCLRDNKCYLAYSKEKADDGCTITYNYLIECLRMTRIDLFTIVTCPFTWSDSIQGFNYWSNKWLNGRSSYLTYINKQ